MNSTSYSSGSVKAYAPEPNQPRLNTASESRLEEIDTILFDIDDVIKSLESVLEVVRHSYIKGSIGEAPCASTTQTILARRFGDVNAHAREVYDRLVSLKESIDL